MLDSPAPSTATDADAIVQRERLRRFVRVMLPVAMVFDLAYLVAAIYLRNAALAGGTAAVALYVVSLVRARAQLVRGETRSAALWTAGALLAMVAVGAPFLHFLLGALVLMPIAGVALVLPYIRRDQLRTYVVCAIAVTAEVVVVDGVLPPLFAQPPAPMARAVLATAAMASTCLTLYLLWVDHSRLVNLLDLAREGLVAAEESNATKDAFLAAAAHDLRTPLSTLQLQIDGIVNGPLGRAIQDDRLRDRLVRAEKQTQRLTRLVDGLLDVSRIAGGRLELTDDTLDFATLVRESVARLEEDITRSGSTLQMHVPATMPLRGDRVRLDQVVTNIVTNAVKYGAGRPIEVTLAREGRDVLLSVRDEGIGIARADLERIFDRFERGPEAANYAGLGIGLWIVRELLSRMDGTIAVESAPDRGATFTVRLPSTTQSGDDAP